MQGWRSAQADRRLAAALHLARGIDGVRREAGEFDRNQDVINTPAGILDLRSGAVRPHDPEELITCVTRVPYVPGARDAAFEAILGSVPVDSVTWLQTRLGQSITGHPPDDDRMLLLSGGGSNGKSALLDTLFKALGDYAAQIPNTLLLSGRSVGSATPEKMTLMGVRFAYMEETPEGGHLDGQALKEVVGTPTISGRHLYKPIVSFSATHSLCLNTNHPPIVGETDHAVWRRLARLNFPFRFRQQADGRGDWLENDRKGDPQLKARLSTEPARRAALAWMVEGAAQWYEGGRVLSGFDPLSVRTDTRSWRTESDLILAYIDDGAVTFDPRSWIHLSDLHSAFRTWCNDRGNTGWSMKVFADRLTGHSGLPVKLTARRRRSGEEGESRPNGWLGEQQTQRPQAIEGLRWSKEHL